jgi:Flp pilus assembly protein TadD
MTERRTTMAQERNGGELEMLRERFQELLQGHDNLVDALGMSLEDILALALVAQQLAQQGQLEEAQRLLEGLVAVDPTNPYLHTCLGTVYMQREMKEEARAAFGVALAFNPEDIVAHTYAGELALEAGEVEAAVQHFQKAVELDPEGKDPFANRARTLSLLVATIAKEVQAKGPGVLHEILQQAQQIQATPEP